MKFETNLNSGDKLKIIIVLFVGLVALYSWYVIKPLASSITSLDDKISTAQQTKQLYYYKVTNLGSAESLHKKSVTELLDTTSRYNKMLNSSQIDKMATSYVMGFGLFPVDLIINMPDGTVNESPYKYSVLPTRTMPPSTTVTTSKSTSGNAAFVNPESLMTIYTRSRLNENGTANSQAKCVSITVVVRGDPEKEQKLIDDLTKKKSLLVTGFSWTNTDPIRVQREDGTYEFVDSGEKILRFDVNFYMAEYPEFEAEVNGNAGSETATEVG
ncbi:MAG: hypothetical protein J5623_06275 [Clostridiales bacterium]|nr:hypothetical protein [Clostridiales bacterium]